MTKRHLELDFDLVISVVPETSTVRDKKLRDEYLALIKDNVERDVLVEIPDTPSLKWREEVIIGKSTAAGGEAAKAYRVIADRCINLT